MKFGFFMMPSHSHTENPTGANQHGLSSWKRRIQGDDTAGAKERARFVGGHAVSSRSILGAPHVPRRTLPQRTSG